ncbi:MAG: hypothetical protein ACOH5I_25005 [Oligoflexus sp.]
MDKHLFTGIILVASLSCQQKMEEQSDKRLYHHLLTPPAGFEPITTIPTNPDGGKVPGRIAAISPEESLRRKQVNEVKPILFGLGAGGITMSTTQDEALDILASPIGSANGIIFYPEDLRIRWSRSGQRSPELFVIGANYKGKLELGGPFGEISMGFKFAPYIQTPDDLSPLLKLIGSLLEGEDLASYDCEAALHCRMDEDETFITFDYRLGGLLLEKSNDLALSIAYFAPERILRPFLREPLIYGQSIAGIALDSTKEEIEARLGPALFIAENGSHYYDNFNVLVNWNAANQPSLMAALSSYRGIFSLPSLNPAERGLGDSFADLSGDDATGLALMQNLYRLFENSEEDCTLINACSMINLDDGIEIQLPGGILGFSADASRRLSYFVIVNE